MFFFFNDTATTEIYTLSLHDALPISPGRPFERGVDDLQFAHGRGLRCDIIALSHGHERRSEEHTSELQSRLHLVCRLLLEKKKKEISSIRRISDIPSTTWIQQRQASS